MLPQIPSRLIGFNAFGLCYDSQLGKTATDPRNFFEYLRAEGYPFNMVKVVCFMNSTLEVQPNRAIPLYKTDKTINPAFLNNLLTLVNKAAEQNFLVQVCLFHYHAVQKKIYAPENMPFDLDYTNEADTVRNRLRRFFTPTLGDPYKPLQKQLVAAVGQKLKNKPNVIWELCNEVRMDGKPSASQAEQVGDNWNLVSWLNQMENTLKANAGDDIHVCTSTGTLSHNEKITCTNVPSTYFDFHMGQWHDTEGTYRHTIQYARDRATQYNPNNYALICNDDGASSVDHPTAPDWQKRTEGNVKNWAGTAFQMGLGYTTKTSYPSKEPWGIPQMRAVKFANNANPETAQAEAKSA